MIPPDVRKWIRSVFRTCNERTATMISEMPNTHENALDLAFIAEVAKFAAPVQFPSKWIVRIDTHFLGGGRHWGEWEIADIGVLLQFRRGGKLLKSKVLLLQSKRLYPSEEAYDEDTVAEYEMGFARLFREDTSFGAVTQPRTFSYGDSSHYAALLAHAHQHKAIEEYEAGTGIPVYYMLYHPRRVPLKVVLPRVVDKEKPEKLVVGARVLPSKQLHAAMKDLPENQSPTWKQVKPLRPTPRARTTSGPGWLVEEFIADLAIDCKVGHVAQSANDVGLSNVFYRRAGPISAAFAVTFDAPPSANTGD